MSKHFTLPTDLNGKPYSPVRIYSWLDKTMPSGSTARDEFARDFDCAPSEIECRLDARDRMNAYIAERREEEFPYSHRRVGARPLTYAEKVF